MIVENLGIVDFDLVVKEIGMIVENLGIVDFDLVVKEVGMIVENLGVVDFDLVVKELVVIFEIVMFEFLMELKVVTHMIELEFDRMMKRVFVDQVLVVGELEFENYMLVE
jgi:hypothetical protein